MSKDLGNRVRNYVFTLNNPPENLTIDDMLKIITARYKCNYVIIGDETGKKGTRHYQGFISLKNNTYFLNLKNYLEKLIGKGLWLHEAYADEKKNKQYCSKDNVYVEYGNPKQTKEQNNQDLIDDILNNMPYIEICQKYANYVFYHYRDFKLLYQDIKQNQKEYELHIKTQENNRNIEKELGIEIEYD